jgi:hypothetical protein
LRKSNHDTTNDGLDNYKSSWEPRVKEGTGGKEMARCPECGKWLWHSPGYFNEYVCPGCGAMLRRERGAGGFFLGTLEVIGYTRGRSSEGPRLPETEIDSSGHIWYYNKDRSLSEALDTTEMKPPPTGGKTKWGHCNHCDAVIIMSNAKFCSNCGARLGHGPEAAGLQRTEEKAKSNNQSVATPEHEEECMVCKLELSEGEDVVWCPHCGNPAHKTHLLEWIRMRNTCPICGKHLSEQFFE